MAPVVKTNSTPIPAFLVYKQSLQKTQEKKRKQNRTIQKKKVESKLKKQKVESILKTSQLSNGFSSKVTPTKKVVKEVKSKKNHGNKNNSINLIKKVDKKIKLKREKTTFRKAQAESSKEFVSTDNPSLDALNLLKWMIDPVSPEEFFTNYWEQRVLHIKRSQEHYYSHILDSSSLDKLLRNNQLHYTRNVDVVSYENDVKEVFNQEGRATASALWDYYSNGCSIRVLNPQTYSPKVHLLLATLQEYFGTMVGANVYLTPPSSQGFAPHYDDIEAFILQLEGRKHWKLYQPSDEDLLARYSSANLEHKDIGEPFMELTLNAGEMLYFPRGTIHEGCTDEDSHSLHITVSVYQQTSYADLFGNMLSYALKRAAENNVEFRRGLPIDFLKNFGSAVSPKDTVLRNSVEKIVAKLMHSLKDYLDIDSAADLLGKKFMYDSMPPVLSKSEAERSSKVDGPCLKDGGVINRIEFDLSTRVRLLRYYCIRLVNENSTPKLYYNTENATVYHGEDEQWLELDSSMVSTIKMLQNSYPRYVEVDKLPLEDDILKLQLISDLWEHGLIITEKTMVRSDE